MTSQTAERVTQIGKQTLVPLSILFSALALVWFVADDRAKTQSEVRMNTSVNARQDQSLTRMHQKLDALHLSNTRIELRLGTLPDKGIPWPGSVPADMGRPANDEDG